MASSLSPRQKDAEDACAALHETTFGDRSVKVQLAKPTEQKEKEKGEKKTKRRVRPPWQQGSCWRSH